MRPDTPTAVRPGEELSLSTLEPYLAQHLGLTQPLEVLQYPSGYSNLTYSLSCGQQQWVLRRPPFGANIKSAHDMGREFRILQALYPVFGKVPRPVLYCPDEHVLGAPFYLMERLQGLVLRRANPELTPNVMSKVAQLFVQTLADLHRQPLNGPIAELGKPEGYVLRQVNGWSERYQKARTHEVRGMEAALAWLPSRMPSTQQASLIHNDFKYDNLLFSTDMEQVLAVLDWEMATLGDPLMDVGTTLGYWAQDNDPPGLKAFGLTHLPGNPSRAELAEMYGQHSGTSLRDLHFYYVFGLFKVGVIMQQIYARYLQGHTQDPRFAGLGQLIGEVGERLQQTLGSGKVD